MGRPTVFFRRGWPAPRDWPNLANEWGEVVYQANSLPQGLHERVQPALSAAPTPTRMVEVVERRPGWASVPVLTGDRVSGPDLGRSE